MIEFIILLILLVIVFVRVKLRGVLVLFFLMEVFVGIEFVVFVGFVGVWIVGGIWEIIGNEICCC